MHEITMPKLSDTMTEGLLVAWRKAVGDKVERGEVVAEVETDKATMELEAFAGGELLEIKIEPGQTIPVGTVIGIIGVAGERSSGKKSESEKQEIEPAEKPAPKPAPPSSAKPAVSEPPKPSQTDEKEVEPESKPAPSSSARPAVSEPPKPSRAGEKEPETHAAPVVRKRARELGIDLTTVTGSGPDSRIMLEDLERPETVRATTSPTTTEDETSAARSGEEAQPLSRMRTAIARTVSESWRTIPHFSITVEVRMDAAERFQRQFKEEGAAVSVTALIVRAATLALKKFPGLNASFRDERIIVHPEINIGIMVGLPDGLLAPVLKGCAGLSLEEIVQRAEQLIERARNRQLSDKELTGGTFAISNLGRYEVLSFNALIQPPMAAILAVGAVRDEVIAQDGRPAVARVMSLTLSIDHRLADGVYAAEFLQTVKHLLEKPDMLGMSRIE